MTGRTTELVLIRHAEARGQGRLTGRRDVEAVLPAPAVLATLRGAAGALDALIASPARRCVATAAALWPGRAIETDPRLWEQDFGTWEGLAYEALPDLGPLTPAQLATHAPPRGESFADLCARARPALLDAAGRGGRVALVVHAGTIRAALGLALGVGPPALAFRLAPFSMTRILCLGVAGFSIMEVNRRFDGS